ncbi:hypothetical protein MP228_000094 [Amoeboaphelidium protococcarum]|nr:hypothetical protein MP228_000094 [Amoeboaphelidium protococcarum]
MSQSFLKLLNKDCQYIIKDVWAENLEEEMKNIAQIVQDYPYVAMDTEFPGVVARPLGNFKTAQDYLYQTLRCNVDLLNLIQLGLTFADEQGRLPPTVCTWQFNFKFNLAEDMYANDSIELLQKSGIDFQKFSVDGINPTVFSELMITSGLVLLDEVKWISFHSSYDFAYLIKVLSGYGTPDNNGYHGQLKQNGLGKTESEFFDVLRLWFPCIYDIKYLMRSCKNLKGGLQDVADELKVERVGPQHQAGSDSLLTALTFYQMRKTYFKGQIDDQKYLGNLYGLGSNTQYIPDSSLLGSQSSLASIQTTESLQQQQQQESSLQSSQSSQQSQQLQYNNVAKHIHNLIAETYDPNAKIGPTGIASTATANDIAINVISGMSMNYQ